MPRTSFSESASGPVWALAMSLSVTVGACAVAQGGPPEITGGSGDGGLGIGGALDAGGAAGNGVSASGSGFGVSGSASVAGSSGSGNNAFGGTSSVAGGGGSSGSSTNGGAAQGGSSTAGVGAGGKGAAGTGSAGTGSAGTGSAGSGSTSCSVSVWSSDKVYQMGDKASKGGMQYTAAYYTQNNDPTEAQNCCGGGKPWASSAACN